MNHFSVLYGRDTNTNAVRILTFTGNHLRVTAADVSVANDERGLPIGRTVLLAGRNNITGEIQVIETTATGAIKVSYP